MLHWGTERHGCISTHHGKLDLTVYFVVSLCCVNLTHYLQ